MTLLILPLLDNPEFFFEIEKKGFLTASFVSLYGIFRFLIEYLREPDGHIGLIKGLYALCPYIAGHWPLPENPSSVENEGILLSLHSEHEFSHGAVIYGIDAY